jgi:hypothetical protein
MAMMAVIRDWILAGAFLTVINVPTSFAQESNIDWKFYGGITNKTEHSVCFFDATDLITEPNGQLRVWTKCLSQKEIDSVDVKKDFDGKIIENILEKVRDNYIPPIDKLEIPNTDTNLDIIRIEAISDISDIQPNARILYEIKCPQEMIHELSVYILKNGKVIQYDKPMDWKYVPPESNASRLSKILCPSNK